MNLMKTTSVLLLSTVSLAAISFGTRAQESGGEVWDQAALEKASARVTKQVEALRGDAFQKPVAVKVASSQDFKDYMEVMGKEIFPEDFEASHELLSRLLNLYAHDLDVKAVESMLMEGVVAGFYDPFSSTFFLVDIVEQGSEGMFLAHELTHALDDQMYDLAEGLRSRTEHLDNLLAYRAVVEGSGTNLMGAWAQKHPEDMDVASMMRLQMSSLESMSKAPVTMVLPLVWGYVGGADFLVRAERPTAGQTKMASTADIHQAFENPPVSTEQVLHPEKYWDAEQRDLPSQVKLSWDELPRGWKVRMENTLGELTLGLVCMSPEKREEVYGSQRAALSVVPTNPFAAGWDGDRCLMLESDGGEKMIYMATVWDTQRDAGEFFAGMYAVAGSIEQNLRGFLDGAKAKRRTAAGVDVWYGEGATEVHVLLHVGASRSDLRKMKESIKVGVELVR